MPHVPHLVIRGLWPDGPLPLSEAQRHHVERVLRRSDGESLSVTDGAGRSAQGILDRGTVVLESQPAHTVRHASVTMAVAPPASADRARFLVEKLAELGVADLLWLRTRHGSDRPPRHDKATAWAASALEQSRGSWEMTVHEAPVDLSDLDGPLVADRSGGPLRQRLPLPGAVTVAIGPEGGWAQEELEGHQTVGLGPSVLRVETAAIVAAATLLA